MRKIHVMNQAEGCAMRVQLDAMIAALRPAGQQASEMGDSAVVRLLDRLYDAHREAREIETRVPVPAPRGVRLAKT